MNCPCGCGRVLSRSAARFSELVPITAVAPLLARHTAKQHAYWVSHPRTLWGQAVLGLEQKLPYITDRLSKDGVELFVSYTDRLHQDLLKRCHGQAGILDRIGLPRGLKIWNPAWDWWQRHAELVDSEYVDHWRNNIVTNWPAAMEKAPPSEHAGSDSGTSGVR